MWFVDCVFTLFRPGDNDDIIDIIDDMGRPDMRQLLGDYFVAEELLRDNPHSLIIITEVS